MKKSIITKNIVNPRGHWAANDINDILEKNFKSSVPLIQGSPIVVPKLYKANYAYILKHEGRQIVFALTYGFVGKNGNKFTLISTTDINCECYLTSITISNDETGYLCQLINCYFKSKIPMKDITWSHIDLPTLYNDHAKDLSKITHEYHFDLDGNNSPTHGFPKNMLIAK